MTLADDGTDGRRPKSLVSPLVQGSPGTEVYDDLLRVFSTSTSAFEQYHSLLALNEIVPLIGHADRANAVSVLNREKSDPRGVGLMADPYIPSWIDAVLAALRDKG